MRFRRGWRLEANVQPRVTTAAGVPPPRFRRLGWYFQPTNLSNPGFSHVLSGFSQQIQVVWGKGCKNFKKIFILSKRYFIFVIFDCAKMWSGSSIVEFNILHIRCRQILSPEIWSDWSFWYLRLHDYPRISLPRCCWLSTHPPSTQMSRLGMTSWSQRRCGSCVNKMEKVCTKSSKSNKGATLTA